VKLRIEGSFALGHILILRVVVGTLVVSSPKETNGPREGQRAMEGSESFQEGAALLPLSRRVWLAVRCEDVAEEVGRSCGSCERPDRCVIIT